MEAINMFIKGLKNAIDPTLSDSQSWTFPTDFMRVINIDGHGMVQTFLKGNTNPSTLYGEEYTLQDGFKLVGDCQCENITYILSYNEMSGEGQIGCYPAPDIVIDSNGKHFDGWGTVKQYQPLCNFKTATTFTDFTHTNFNFGKRLIDCSARLDYDGSVNIYFVDNHNPDRVINSGFNQLGISTEKFYIPSNFSTIIQMTPQNATNTNIRLKSVDNNGSLMYGNYFVFIRYLTASFDKTSFVAHTGAIQIHDNLNDTNEAQGGKFSLNSDKAITLEIDNIDSDYMYYELAWVRHYSDGNSPVQFETKLVDNYYSIDEVNPVISDYENVLDLTLAEVIYTQSDELVSKTIKANENVLFKANTTSLKLHDDCLIEFAKRILPFTVVDEHIDTGLDVTQYKDYHDTYDKVSYFGGEIYAFSIKANFTNGTTSDAYPIKGIDNYLGNILSAVDFSTANSTLNDKGIYRFPSRGLADTTYNLYHEYKIRNLGLRLDYSDAITYLNSNADAKLFFDNNVKSITICRAKRKPTLEAQGLSMSLANPDYAPESANVNITTECAYPNMNKPPWLAANCDYQLQPGRQDNPLTGFYLGVNVHLGYIWGIAGQTSSLDPSNQPETLIPLYRGYVPMCAYYDTNTTVCYADRMKLESKFYGIYSPDIIFRGNQYSNKVTHVQSIGKTIYNGNDYWNKVNTANDADRTTPTYDLETAQNSYVNGIDTPIKDCDVKLIGNTEILPSTSIPFNAMQLCNSADGDGILGNKNNHLIFNHTSTDENKIAFNRSIYTLPYLALYADYTQEEHLNLNIVNLYNQDPTGIVADLFTSYYNINSIDYFDISEAITVADIEEISISHRISFDYFNGDCFAQRVTIRQCSWKATNIYLNKDDETISPVGTSWNDDENRGAYSFPAGGDPMRYAHGKRLSFITENAVNNAMRYENDANGNTYYPKNAADNNWAIKPALGVWYESFLINHGHSNTLALRTAQAFNFNLPFIAKNYPTRIRHSAKHQPGSYIDGYRIWNIDAYKDYTLENGQIVSLKVIASTLISIQERSVNQHYSNQKQQKADINTGEMILGIGPILAEETLPLIAGGSQHQFSVKETDNGIYGIDYQKKMIWAVQGANTAMGTMKLGGADLSSSKEVAPWLKEMIDSYTTSNVKGNLEDSPYDNIGFVTGYDPIYKEVLFTFLKPIQKSIACELYIDDTFNMEYYLFNSRMSYTYGNIVVYNDKFYWNTIHGNSTTPGIDSGWNEFDIDTAILFEAGMEIEQGDLVYQCGQEEDAIGILYIATQNYIVYPHDAKTGYTLITNIDGLGIGEKQPNSITVKCICDTSKTLVYSEGIQQFTSVYPIGPYKWLNTDLNLYSAIPTDYFNTGKIYLHNQSEILTFWQKNREAIISVVINGMSEKENTQPFQKRYDSYQIVCSNNVVTNVRLDFNTASYKTDGQEVTQNFNSNGLLYWRDPEWLENRWQVPIDVSTINGQEYQTESSITGGYLRITLTYNQKEIGYIKQIITNFSISFA